ncbi:MAG: S8 family serine peptidase, partial [Thermoplasmatota archaeon]
MRNTRIPPIMIILLLTASIIPLFPALSATNDEVQTGPEWWDVLPVADHANSWGHYDPFILYLGPVLFDPLHPGADFSEIPSERWDGRFILQLRSPEALQDLLTENDGSFMVVDILSPLAILIEPSKPGDLDGFVEDENVRALVPYQSLFKIESGLFDYSRLMRGKGEVPVVIGFYYQPDRDLIDHLESISSTPLDEHPSDGVIFCTLPVRELLDIGADPSISHISLDHHEEIDNDVAADIVDVMEVWDTLGLNGTGQFVAIADTGLDTGVNSTLHPDFRGRVSSVYTYGRSGNWSDWDIHIWDPVNGQWDYKGGHGTHVAGSVLGNGTMSGGDISGMAPAANIVMQSTMTSTGSLSIPAYSSLFGDAYSSKARVQTNSWSTRGSYGNYTWRSWQTDHFVWNNKDLVVLFSAGNNGGKGPYYVSTQASSKNVIAVGGSENYRPTLSSSANNISEMAYFSSEGYTWGDLRVKPDVVAPGTYILSTRSTIISDPANHYWRAYNGSYAYNGGTSMSTPIVAG